jgi:hypothetical protein
VKIIDPSIELVVTPFENWWFKINLGNVADNVIWWVIILGITSVIAFFTHTGGEAYTVDVSHSTMNGDINIVNIQWEWHIFHQSILPIVREDKTRKCLQQICESLNQEDDYVAIENKDVNLELVWSGKITYEEKWIFDKPIWEEKNNFTIRWWIYEMNYKQKTFRVQIHEGYSFSVTLAENLNIADIKNFADTDALEITGSVKMSREWKILSMKMYSFSEAQIRMDISESK